MTLIKIPVAILMLFTLAEDSYSQILTSKVRLMFYNVENLFDTSDDTLKDDNEFLPYGPKRWSIKRYNKKINSIYKTIVSTGDWDPPEIVAFCEIEHRSVLEDLSFRTYLAKYNYDIVHQESPDRRGIDVCLIYQKKMVKLIYFKYMIPVMEEFPEYNSRSVLYAKFGVGNDSLHLFVNHWPSRRGGVLTGEKSRQDIASMIRNKVDSITDRNPNSKIIIAGDFNCTPDDKVVRDFLKSSDTIKSLINMSDSLSFCGSGTYRYMGSWEMIDQVIVSRSLIFSENGLTTKRNQLRIFDADFLMQKDTKYPGFSPYPTYRGYKYLGGFSDHLPVLLDLSVRY